MLIKMVWYFFVEMFLDKYSIYYILSAECKATRKNPYILSESIENIFWESE